MHNRIVLGLLATIALGSVPVLAQQPASPIRRIAQVTIVVEDQDQAFIKKSCACGHPESRTSESETRGRR